MCNTCSAFSSESMEIGDAHRFYCLGIILHERIGCRCEKGKGKEKHKECERMEKRNNKIQGINKSITKELWHIYQNRQSN